MSCLGKQVNAEAHQTVSTKLDHDGSRNDDTGNRRLLVGVAQPSVQREERNLDGKRNGESNEQPAGFGI